MEISQFVTTLIYNNIITALVRTDFQFMDLFQNIFFCIFFAQKIWNDMMVNEFHFWVNFYISNHYIRVLTLRGQAHSVQVPRQFLIL